MAHGRLIPWLRRERASMRGGVKNRAKFDTDLGASAARLLAMQTVLSLLSMFVAYNLTDADVVADLPLLGIPFTRLEVGAREFLSVTPLALFALMIYFQIALHRVQRPSEIATHASETGSVWLFSDLMRSYLRPHGERLHGDLLEKPAAALTIWWVPLQAQYAMSDRHIGLHGTTATLWHLSFITLNLAVFVFYFSRSNRRALSWLFFSLFVAWVGMSAAANAINTLYAPLWLCSPDQGMRAQWTGSQASVLDDVCKDGTGYSGTALTRYLQPIVITIGDAYLSFGPIRRSAQLDYARLSRFESDLQTSDSTLAYIRGAQLHGTDLRNSSLEDAFLEQASIQNSDLAGAIGWGVDLKGAYIFGTHLTTTILSDGNLQEANIDASPLIGTQLKSADMTGAWLSELWIDRADFEYANLHCVRFTLVTLYNANFTGTNLSDVAFLKSDFSRALGVTQADLPGACADGSKLPPGVSLPSCLSGDYYKNCAQFVPEKLRSMIRPTTQD